MQYESLEKSSLIERTLRHGGVAVYTRKDTSMKNIYPSIPVNLEHILIESDEKKTLL